MFKLVKKYLLTSALVLLFAFAVTAEEAKAKEAEAKVEDITKEVKAEPKEEAKVETAKTEDKKVEEVKTEAKPEETAKEEVAAKDEPKAEATTADTTKDEAVTKTDSTKELADVEEKVATTDSKKQAKFHFGVAINPGLKWLDTDPLTEIAAKDPVVMKRTYDFSKDLMPIMNVAFYWDPMDNGFRFGPAITFGRKNYQSEVFRDTVPYIDDDYGYRDTLIADFTSNITVHILSASLLIEKAIILKNFRIHFGTKLGGGSVYLTKVNVKYNYDNQWDNGYDDDYYYDDPDIEKKGSLSSYTFNWDVHAGATYKFNRMFALGLEGLADFNEIITPYNNTYAENFTWSPGIRLKFIIGTAK